MSFFKKIFFAFTKQERTVFLAAAAVAVLSSLALAGIFIAKATTAVPTAGGEYTEGVAGQPEYVNPVTATSETDLNIVKMVYSNIPDAADAITASPDGKTWTVRLKENLHWQDGGQLTSDDVVFTVASIQNPDSQSPLASVWNGVSVSRVSELEVQFSLPAPYAFFGDDLSNLYIIPKHIFVDVPPGNWRLSDYNLKPVGSGPYEFVSYDQGSDGFIGSYQLAAWNNAFEQRPLIPSFTFDFFRNESDLVKSFNNGQIDGFALASPADEQSINRPYNLFAARTTDYYAVFLNQSANTAFQDPAVRIALSLAVDRNGLIENALGGNGVPDIGPIPEGAAYFSPVTAPTSSEDIASTTLDAAGWKLDANGNRSKIIKKTSVPLTVTLTVPDIDFLTKTAQVLQNDWQSIGVATTIVTDAPTTIVSDTITNRGYEALLFGNVLGPSSDLYSFWDSSGRFSPGLNLAIMSDPQVDKLIAEARANMNDATRTQELATAQSDIIADAPAVFLYSTNDLYAASKNIKGIATSTLSDPSDLFREVPAWYLQTARVLK
ncbi:MAG: ABC transporter substrate-binding protein [Minisyncoccia bacterium]